MDNVQYMQLISHLANASIALNAATVNVLPTNPAVPELNALQLALTNALKAVASAAEGDPASQGSTVINSGATT